MAVVVDMVVVGMVVVVMAVAVMTAVVVVMAVAVTIGDECVCVFMHALAYVSGVRG
jgi:hypothetical protein